MRLLESRELDTPQSNRRNSSCKYHLETEQVYMPSHKDYADDDVTFNTSLKKIHQYTHTHTKHK